MATTDLNLIDAIARAGQLDPVALGQVYDAYFPQIFCYVRFRLGVDARAHELSSQVFDHLLETFTKRSKPIDPLDCWLFESARKLVEKDLNQASRPNKTNSTTHIEIDFPPTENQAAWLNLLVRKSLQKLLPEQQHLLALRFGVLLSIEETSRIAGKSIAEVKGIQFEALLSLRDWLEKEA